MWVGRGNPCDEEDLNFFYASTTIKVGNGAKTPFWESPWLLGRKPKDIAPLIYESSSRKHWKVREALKENECILKIRPPAVVSTAHVAWKHSDYGHYSTASAYRAQFLGLVLSPWTKWFGSLGPHRRSSSLLGSHCKIEFEPLIDWLSGVGQIVAPAPCAGECKNVEHIYSSDAASR